ncbi:hypothetical protein P3T18_003096 [Paraburkholderia sp. GAS199]|uniref:hypothetical protein n=1 Tax=Paraburkholderia sp. GAS199 TaxID=3035126 RepID=UPI003D23BCD2
MSEFNNRIDAQRSILHVVNSGHWEEELFGLSRGSIDRWMRINKIAPSNELAQAVYEAADKLFFLANKSQEQITEEYQLLSLAVSNLTRRIEDIVDRHIIAYAKHEKN